MRINLHMAQTLKRLRLNSELMKRIGFVLLGLFCLTTINAQKDYIDSVELEIRSLHRVKYQVFEKGEKLEYLVHYGFLDAGTATIEIMNEDHSINGRDALRVVGVGKSKGAFDWFFKVRDYYETYIDKSEIIPYKFSRDISEGGYKFKQDYQFTQERKEVKTQKGETHRVPYGIQDMLSAYYFARTIDVSQYNIGDVIVMQAFVDDKIEPLKIRYVGKETISIKTGKYDCLKFQPLVQPGRIFNDPEDLTIYITDDKNKVPVLCRAKVLVGSIKMELINHRGLSFPLAKVD